MHVIYLSSTRFAERTFRRDGIHEKNENEQKKKRNNNQRKFSQTTTFQLNWSKYHLVTTKLHRIWFSETPFYMFLNAYYTIQCKIFLRISFKFFYYKKKITVQCILVLQQQICLWKISFFSTILIALHMYTYPLNPN